MSKLLLTGLSVFFLSLVTNPILAGTEGGGGGHIFGDQLNPWFLQNTTDVRYCVEISPEFSQVSREKVLEIIGKSFNFWKLFFLKHEGSSSYEFDLSARVGTQNFIFNNDCDSVDLKFQLGFLSEEQKKIFPNYRQLLGLAHRIHYDEKLLKGKGFIYIAPETGELRPLSTQLHSRPWSYGKNLVLEQALIHEIGHLFGFQDDLYSNMSIMSGSFVEEITKKNAVREINRERGMRFSSPLGCNKFFEGKSEIWYGGMSDSQRVRLGLPPGTFKINYQSKNKILTIKINGKKFGFVQLKPAASVTYVIQPAIRIYLSKAQKVFKKIPSDELYAQLTIYHVKLSTLRRDEVLNLADGTSMNAFIRFDQDCKPTIGTVLNDKVNFDIFMGM